MILHALILAACTSKIHVELTAPDEALRPAFERDVASAERTIEQFFGRPFAKAVTITVCPSRKAFDEALRRKWGMEATQPWMVGAAGARVLFVLSPRVWKSEAQEHNPDDSQEIADIVTHELVHSFHAQVNPNKDLEGLDDMAWFAEGLATYVSGQLARSHKGVAKREIEDSRGPKDLATAWSGRGRYGVSGSMVNFVDAMYGRRAVRTLLTLTTNADALKALKTDEPTFLADWKSWVSRS